MGRPVRCRRTACVVFQGVSRKEGFNAVGWFGSLQLLVYIASRAGEGVACSIGAVDGNVPCLVMVKCCVVPLHAFCDAVFAEASIGQHACHILPSSK